MLSLTVLYPASPRRGTLSRAIVRSLGLVVSPKTHFSSKFANTPIPAQFPSRKTPSTFLPFFEFLSCSTSTSMHVWMEAVHLPCLMQCLVSMEGSFSLDPKSRTEQRNGKVGNYSIMDSTCAVTQRQKQHRGRRFMASEHPG